jgi:predicted nucleic acid-binding protein
VRLTLDTNILAYAEGVNGSSMKEVALDLVQKLPQDTTFLPVQVLGELINPLVRKGGRTRARACGHIELARRFSVSRDLAGSYAQRDRSRNP